MEALSESSS